MWRDVAKMRVSALDRNVATFFSRQNPCDVQCAFATIAKVPLHDLGSRHHGIGADAVFAAAA
jgi:hypothetical protein